MKKLKRILWNGFISILLWTLAAVLLFICAQHLELLIALGICSIAFFYRALFYKTPEQRKTDKERKAKIEAERRQWERHKFYPVSKRARTAYLILCLEEAIQYYSQDVQGWERVLRQLWEVAAVSCEDEWDICDLLPEEIFTCATYEEVAERLSTADSEEQFLFLLDLYACPGSAFEVIGRLLDNISLAFYEGGLEGETPYAPSALQYIDQTERLLREEGVPLPHDEQALNFLISQKGKYFGKPFDGLRFSILSKSSAL